MMHVIDFNGYKFIVTEAPTEKSIGKFLTFFKLHNVKHFVRLSEQTYPISPFMENGISTHDLSFEDGKIPSPKLIEQWIDIVKMVFSKPNIFREAIAVHCIAGLGRSPLMVALALIDYFHVNNVSAIDIIRKKIKCALNKQQLEFIQDYKNDEGCCFICRVQ